MNAEQRVVIIGGGFGGLYAARALRRAPVAVTLIDRHNHHLFQPLLYQVATGALSPANIAAPLRELLGRQKNTRVLMAEVMGIDVAARTLQLRDCPETIGYDTLVVATGSRFNYFGHDEWSDFAPGLKTIEDAVTIRRRVLGAFERAELETDRAAQRQMLTFVVVGAGPTGVEMAGALAEMARDTLRGDFRNVDPGEARIVLVEAQGYVLGQFPPALRDKAAESLRRLGVELRLQTTVTGLDEHGVTLAGPAGSERLSASTVLWTAGVKASSFAAALAQAVGQEPDRGGRLRVEADLTLPGHPEIFVIGDLALAIDAKGQPLPGLAPVAMQQGRYVAGVIRRRLAGRAQLKPFRYFDRGSMATIGRAAAVADFGWLQLSGLLAWLGWLFIHLLYLAKFQNRLLVMVQWAYSYLTRGRAARLITQEPPRVVR